MLDFTGTEANLGIILSSALSGVLVGVFVTILVFWAVGFSHNGAGKRAPRAAEGRSYSEPTQSQQPKQATPQHPAQTQSKKERERQEKLDKLRREREARLTRRAGPVTVIKGQVGEPVRGLDVYRQITAQAPAAEATPEDIPYYGTPAGDYDSRPSITVMEAHRMYGIHRPLVYSLFKKGKLVPVRREGANQISLDDLDWLRRKHGDLRGEGQYTGQEGDNGS